MPDPLSLIVLAIWLLAAGMYPVGLMLGAPCSKCGCQGCPSGTLCGGECCEKEQVCCGPAIRDKPNQPVGTSKCCSNSCCTGTCCNNDEHCGWQASDLPSCTNLCLCPPRECGTQASVLEPLGCGIWPITCADPPIIEKKCFDNGGQLGDFDFVPSWPFCEEIFDFPQETNVGGVNSTASASTQKLWKCFNPYIYVNEYAFVKCDASVTLACEGGEAGSPLVGAQYPTPVIKLYCTYSAFASANLDWNTWQFVPVPLGDRTMCTVSTLKHWVISLPSECQMIRWSGCLDNDRRRNKVAVYDLPFDVEITDAGAKAIFKDGTEIAGQSDYDECPTSPSAGGYWPFPAELLNSPYYSHLAEPAPACRRESIWGWFGPDPPTWFSPNARALFNYAAENFKFVAQYTQGTFSTCRVIACNCAADVCFLVAEVQAYLDGPVVEWILCKSPPEQENTKEFSCTLDGEQFACIYKYEGINELKNGIVIMVHRFTYERYAIPPDASGFPRERKVADLWCDKAGGVDGKDLWIMDFGVQCTKINNDKDDPQYGFPGGYRYDAFIGEMQCGPACGNDGSDRERGDPVPLGRAVAVRRIEGFPIEDPSDPSLDCDRLLGGRLDVKLRQSLSC